MTINHYYYNGIEYSVLPNPFMGDSPMTPERFVELGGEIRKAEKLTPQEEFKVGLDTYLDGLEKTCRETLGLAITKAEFKAAAATMMSSDLIAWAKSKEVPDSMIESVRSDILTMIADASRLGMIYGDIFPKAEA